jgi:histidinol-phosphate transaminase
MSRFIRELYKDFKSYTPGEQPKDRKYLKLNTNESPFPPAPAVYQAMRDANMEDMRLYPDPTGRKLKVKMAELYEVQPENVFLSNGSDDILNFAFMAWNDTNDSIVIPDVTYSFYEVVARLHEINYEIKPLRDDLTLDLEGYIGIDKNIVLPNPNAPTGIALSRTQIEELVRSNPDNVVIIDEAYAGFGAESAIPLTRKYDNLLVVQTFSKSRSFAGGRLGFAVGDAALIEDLTKMQYSTNPYAVNAMSLILAEAAVDAEDYYQENLQRIIEARDYAADKLNALGFEVLPSQANFLYMKLDGFGGRELYEKLKARGVLVRHFAKPRIDDYIRVTIGTKEQMDELIEVIKVVLADK